MFAHSEGEGAVSFGVVGGITDVNPDVFSTRLVTGRAAEVHEVEFAKDMAKVRDWSLVWIAERKV